LKWLSPFPANGIVCLGALVILATAVGCSLDADYKRVAFTRKDDAVASQPVSTDRELLRMALAAMISSR